jgi:PKD repeat protein
VGDTITSFAFDASASSDAEDGASLLREWDYESDGVFDQSGVTANHSYPSAGTYTVTLRVTDSDGNTATATRNVFVASAGSLLQVTTGTDENDGSANPTLSLREAIDVSNGTAGRQTIVLSGVTSRPISNLPIITDGVDIVGDGGAIDGTGMGNNRNCLNSQSTGTRFLALEIYGCARHAIQIQNGDNNEVRGCYIHDLAGGGIFTAASTGHVIEANEIGFATDFGVSINSGATDVIANYVHDTSLLGIDVGGGATGARLIGNRSIGGSIGIQLGAATVKVWFNTVVGAAQSALQASAGPCDVRNNMFVFAGTYGTLGAQGNFAPLDYNLVFGNGSGPCNNCTHGVHSVVADPSFVVPASPLFRPQQGGPASNAGIDVGFGRDGTPGAAYSGGAPDIGYIEVE